MPVQKYVKNAVKVPYQILWIDSAVLDYNSD